MNHLPDRERSRRRGMLAALPLALFIGGCGGGAPPPRITDGAYEGPPLSIDQSGRTAVVVMEAPTPGWSVTVDRSSEARDHWQAFVTIRRPNPAYMYAQMIVQQNLLTTVESRRPLRVYARVLEFADQSIDGEYREAVRADPSTTEPAIEKEFPREFEPPPPPPGGPGT